MGHCPWLTKATCASRRNHWQQQGTGPSQCLAKCSQGHHGHLEACQNRTRAGCNHTPRPQSPPPFQIARAHPQRLGKEMRASSDLHKTVAPVVGNSYSSFRKLQEAGPQLQHVSSPFNLHRGGRVQTSFQGFNTSRGFSSASLRSMPR